MSCQAELLFRVLQRHPLGISALNLIDESITEDETCPRSVFDAGAKRKRKVCSLKRALFSQRKGRRVRHEGLTPDEWEPSRSVMRVRCLGEEFSYTFASVRPLVSLVNDTVEAERVFLGRMARVRLAQGKVTAPGNPASCESWQEDMFACFVSNHITDTGLTSVLPHGATLFAERDLPAGYVLGVYFGTVRWKSEYDAKRAAAKADTVEYGVEVCNFLTLDPTDDQNRLVYQRNGWLNPLPLMNEAYLDKAKQNVRMIFDEEPDNVQFVTTRTVRAGEELLAAYGTVYDRSHYRTSFTQPHPNAADPDVVLWAQY